MPLPRLLPLLVLAAWAAPAAAQLQGVGYGFAPGLEYVRFEDNAGLTDGALFGGSLRMSFGEFVDVGGGYYYGTGFETDFARFRGLEEAPDVAAALAALDPRQVVLSRYGGELQLRLSRTGLAPFLTGGAGVLRFDPDGRPATENVYLAGGAGLQLTGADRYALTLQGGWMGYRYNPGSAFFNADELAEVGLTYDRFNEVLVGNLGLQASARLYLGGRRPGVLTEVDRAVLAGGLRLQVEPFFGRITFDETLGYRDGGFLGAEAGVDFGPLVGLRAFYARGLDGDDPFSPLPVQLYGGHIRLRLSEGSGVAPYFTLGAGYFDVLSGYEAPASGTLATSFASPQDRPFALGGAGLDVPLGGRFRLLAEARALLFSAQDEADLSRPERVYVAPMLRAGATFGFGGRSAPTAPIPLAPLALEREIALDREGAARRAAELELEIRDALARGNAGAVARLQAEQARAFRIARPEAGADDVIHAIGPEGETITVRRPPGAEPVASGVAPRERHYITIPVPEQGEIYIRYGEPGGVQIVDGAVAPRAGVGLPGTAAAPTDDDLRALVRDAVRDASGEPAAQAAGVEAALETLLRRELEREGATDLTAADLQLLERRLMDRFYEELRGIRARDDRPIIIQQPPVVVPVPGAVPVAPSGFVGARPLAGLAIGRGPNQAVAGVRMDYFAAGGFFPVRYYPELLFGAGSRNSIALNLNGIVPFTLRDQPFTPYAGAGFGLVSYAGPLRIETDPFFGEVSRERGPRSFVLAFNTLVGTEYAFGGNRVFGEFGLVNLGRFGRIQGGYRFVF